MQKKRPWLSSLIAGAAAAVAGLASAAGLGAGGTTAVLGQPLDFAVQVRLDAGETLSPDCIVAEVTMGDRRLLPGQVRTVLDFQSAELARVRVQTTVAIDEPVVGVQLGAGCTSRQTRRFVLLADPPTLPAAAPAFAANLPDAAPLTLPAATVAPPPSVVATAAPAAVAEATLSTPPSTPRADTAITRGVAAPVAAESLRRVAAVRDEAVPQAAAPSGSAPARAAARADRRPVERRVAAAPARKAEAPARPRAASAATVAAAPSPGPAPEAAVATPRLKLDFEEPLASSGSAIIEEALQAVALAATSARAAASAASASADRIAALEHTVDELRNEATASRQLVAELRSREGRGDESSRWTYPLLIAVLLLAALAAWLGWRLTTAQRQRETGWRAATGVAPVRPPAPRERPPSAPPTAPIPFVTTEVRMPESSAQQRPAWPPAAPDSRFGPPTSMLPPIPDTVLQAGGPPSVSDPFDFKAKPPKPKPEAPPEREREREPADTAMQRTEPLPPSLRADDGTPRDVSIEELIDLEQQAEFFVVLGQDEAAIDLLVEHLRHTGGGSPLPYLKLLEIYHRRGDRDDYERTRARFNQRFNAYAPDWGVDLQAGRSLEDYEGIVPRLQQAWPRPLDAMAELEVLLFRKSMGELFDLPAYREVLLLYSLARDLHDREAVDAGNVDLLLPLADVGDFGATTAAPYLGLRPVAVERLDRADLYDPPTAPVDFDLSKDSDRQSSIFDPLDDRPPRPSRR